MRMNSPSPGKDVSFKAVSELVAVQLEGIYSKSSIPTVSGTRIFNFYKHFTTNTTHLGNHTGEIRIMKMVRKFTKTIAESQKQLFNICMQMQNEQ